MHRKAVAAERPSSVPKVPYSDNVVPLRPQLPPPDPQSLMLAAGMMYQEGKFFAPQEQGRQAEGEPDLGYAKPKDDWNKIIQHNSQMIDPDKLSPKHLKALKDRGVKID